MSIVFGTSVDGKQTLSDALVREGRFLVLGIQENSGVYPEPVGYGYILAKDYPGTSEYLFWRGRLYKPGFTIELPTADGTFFSAIRFEVDWDKPGIDWFLAV